MRRLVLSQSIRLNFRYCSRCYFMHLRTDWRFVAKMCAKIPPCSSCVLCVLYYGFLSLVTPPPHCKIRLGKQVLQRKCKLQHAYVGSRRRRSLCRSRARVWRVRKKEGRAEAGCERPFLRGRSVVAGWRSRRRFLLSASAPPSSRRDV